MDDQLKEEALCWLLSWLNDGQQSGAPHAPPHCDCPRCQERSQILAGISKQQRAMLLDSWYGRDRERIAELLDSLQELFALARRHSARITGLGNELVLEPPPEDGQSRRACARLSARIVRTLWRYQQNRVAILLPGRHLVQLDGRPTDMTPAEWSALRVIDGLGDEVERLRRCRVCSRWMFARFSAGNCFCSVRRDQKFKASDELKRQRREYARETYRAQPENRCRKIAVLSPSVHSYRKQR